MLADGFVNNSSAPRITRYFNKYWMSNVYDCVEAFEKLLDKEYHLILGRKNVSVLLQIG